MWGENVCQIVFYDKEFSRRLLNSFFPPPPLKSVERGKKQTKKKNMHRFARPVFAVPDEFKSKGISTSARCFIWQPPEPIVWQSKWKVLSVTSEWRYFAGITITVAVRLLSSLCAPWFRNDWCVVPQGWFNAPGNTHAIIIFPLGKKVNK